MVVDEGESDTSDNIPFEGRGLYSDGETETGQGNGSILLPGDHSDDDGGVSDEGEGEDLDENMEADYVAIPGLDTYDPSLMDKREYETMDVKDRMAAEFELADRDTVERDRKGALEGLLDEYGEEDEAERRARRARFGITKDRKGGLGVDEGDGREREGGDRPDEDTDDGRDEDEINLEEFNVPLQEWLGQEHTRKEVRRRFRRFLQTFPEGSEQPIHLSLIRAMCSANLASLEVSYTNLSSEMPLLAIWLAEDPRDMLDLMDEVATRLVVRHFPEYHHIQDEIHVRITDLPITDRIRDLREVHLRGLVRVAGVVIRRTGVFPQLRLVKYTCQACGMILGPYTANTGGSGGGGEARPLSCPYCPSNGPFPLNQEETVYRNFQKITLQESPGSVPPGRVPRCKDVILLSDLIDVAKPGEEVEITGIYSHSIETFSLAKRGGFPIFGTQIEANYVLKQESRMSAHALTDADKAELQNMARDPRIGKRIVASIAPSIYGHKHIKQCIAMALFGGCAKDVNGKHRIRGDINVLLLGDPGTAKSQVLKYCEQTAPRAVYTTGKGASAVGLTAAVHRDPLTKEWTLEGGALVLADKGVCLIDEFDKMTEQDRTSIHEAMEQQSISVSKAGIVTSLQARCSVIASANPIGGRYDATLTLAENVELTDPILQRFDCLCVVQDMVDPVADEQLAQFVVGSHIRSHPSYIDENIPPDDQETERGGGGGKSVQCTNNGVEVVPQTLLRKYIMYARNHVRPQLRDIDQDKVSRLYADLRRESMSSGGIPVAVRHIESIIRMAEAHARMHLRDHVRDDDVDAGIAVLLQSFIQAQKFSVRRSLEKGFRKYLHTGQDFNDLLMRELQRLVRQAQTFQQLKRRAHVDKMTVDLDDLEAKAREFNIYDLTPFFESANFSRLGFSVDKVNGVIIKTFDD